MKIKSRGYFLTNKIQRNQQTQKIRIGYHEFKKTKAEIQVKQQKTVTQGIKQK